MNTRQAKRILKSCMPAPLLALSIVAMAFGFPGTVWGQVAPSDCVVMGGLAWDDWTREDAGGSGMPDGEADSDYWRCKSCHGWDIRGTDGGYVRRSRNEGRPNAGAGDSDQTSRNIAYSDRGGASIIPDMIFHAGTGRSFADGTGSWVALEENHSAANKAAHANGYTLGNQHPDFSTGGANALTQEQADCLVEFLNFEDADWEAYFKAIYSSANPVIYVIREDADADRGETRYTDVCFDCHGDPSEVGVPFPIEGDEGILEFLSDTSHFSEFYQKVRWGHPDSAMTREALGDPTALDVADVMLYLQELGGAGGFYMTPGLNGAWYNIVRDGEGFNVEVASDGGAGYVFVAFFYTYDDEGNQVFLVAQGTVDGDTADVTVYITDGAMWGDDFNPDDVSLVEWGTGTFVANDCDAMSFTMMPNDAMQAEGFTDLAYDLERLTIPTNCP
jgi:hypothetical protein